MTRKGKIGAFLLLAFGLSFRISALDTEVIVERVKPCVVVLEGVREDNGATVQSSGCCVGRDGLVLTTAHQVVGVKDIKGRLFDGSEFALEVVEVERQREIAMLKADRAFVSVAEVGDAATLRSGADLISIAAPRSLDFSVVPGTVSNTNRTLRDYPVIQASLRAAPGSSGGPVFDRDGRLVGMIIGKLRDEEWITAVNPVNNAFDLLRAHGVALTAPTALLDEMAGELMPARGISQAELRALEAYNRAVRVSDPRLKKDDYGMAVELLPEFYEAWFNLAVTLTSIEDIAGAVAAYKKAASLRPEAVEVPRNLGRLYLRVQRLDDAAAAFNAALELAPAEAQSHNDLGEVYRQMQKSEDAIRAFQMALTLKPDYAAAQYNLGITFAGIGKNAEAAQYFKKYLELAPDAADAAQVGEWIAELEKPK